MRSTAQAAVFDGAGFDPTVVVADAGDFGNDQPFARSVLRHDAGCIDGFDNRQAGTIAAGHFGLIDPDFAVINLQAVERGENVFDHLDLGVARGERGPPRRFEAIKRAGIDAHVRREIAADEEQAGIDGRGSELDPDIFAAPISEAGKDGHLGQRLLCSQRGHQGSINSG